MSGGGALQVRSTSREDGQEIQRLESALRKCEKLAHIGRLTASMMHEINNPAEAIGNLAYLISENAGNSELVRSLSLQLEEQLRRIQYVCRQTLSFFREQPTRQNTDLVALIETAIRFHRSLLEKKRIHLGTQMPDRLFAPVFPGDLLQLVSNLIHNALQATEPGGDLCIRLRSHRDRIRLTIADNGCGIPEQVRSHLFQPFQTSKAEVGNGLGLWICKEVAQMHGGRLAWRTSTEPECHGTTFSISLAS
jgi:signal transduction histidine kinase